jgi:uncharacterized spore protein YtfJ
MPVETSERSELASDLLEQIGKTVGQRAQASAVFGEAVHQEGLTVIPVAKARFGFGGGGGGGTSDRGDQGSGGGGGGGAAVTPIGFIEVRGDGAQFKRITSPVDLVSLATAGAIAALTVRRLLG